MIGDVWHKMTKFADYYRYLLPGIVAIAAALALTLAGGCEPVTTSPFSGAEVTRGGLDRETIARVRAVEAETETEAAALQERLRALAVEAEDVRTRGEALRGRLAGLPAALERELEDVGALAETAYDDLAAQEARRRRIAEAISGAVETAPEPARGWLVPLWGAAMTVLGLGAGANAYRSSAKANGYKEENTALSYENEFLRGRIEALGGIEDDGDAAASDAAG